MRVRRIRLAFLLLAAALAPAAPANAQSPADALPGGPVPARRIDIASGDLLGAERIQAGQETAALAVAVERADRLASVLGPLAYGPVLQTTGSHRWAMASIGVFFVVGLALLTTVDEKKGIELAGVDELRVEN